MPHAWIVLVAAAVVVVVGAALLRRRRDVRLRRRVEPPKEAREPPEEAADEEAGDAPLLDRTMPSGGGGGAEPGGHDLRFTVYRPGVAAPGRWYDLLVFMHELDLPTTRLAEDLPPRERIEREARRILGEEAPAYMDATEDAAAAVPREGQLTFLVELPGFRVNPPRQTVAWHEELQHVRFRIRADPVPTARTARGRLTVFHGPLILAEMALVIAVGEGSDEAVPEPLTPYRRIFASYAREDDGIVRRVGALAASVGDRYLRDVTELHAGEEWNPGLARLIEEADIFQLFWSWNAMDSEWVRREWTHALSLGRPGFVRPVYWEEPLPSRPDEGLPPPELTELHFHRLPRTLVEEGLSAGPPPGPAGSGGPAREGGTGVGGPTRGAPTPPPAGAPRPATLGGEAEGRAPARFGTPWRSAAVLAALALGVGAGSLWLQAGPEVGGVGAGPYTDVSAGDEGSLEPPDLRLVVGDSTVLEAAAADSGRSPLDGSVTWRSADPGVASVDSTGLVVARGPGRTIVTATAERLTREVPVTVEPPPSAIVLRTAAGERPVEGPLVLAPGESVDLDAVALDAQGGPVEPGRVRWSAEPASVVTVDPDGVVSARGPGVATVTVRAGTVSARVTVRVEGGGAPVSPPPRAPSAHR